MSLAPWRRFLAITVACLGMAIARRIVEAHSGRIDVGDASSGGAEIVIILPRGSVGNAPAG